MPCASRAKGAAVVVADINAEGAAAVAAEAAALGVPTAAIRVDVSDEASCQALAAAVVERFWSHRRAGEQRGHLPRPRPRRPVAALLQQDPLGEHDRGLAHDARRRRTMKHQRRGKIIKSVIRPRRNMNNVGFVDTSNPDQPSPPFHYGLAKLGVSGLTKYFAGSLGPFGVNVNAICPGVTLTRRRSPSCPNRSCRRSSTTPR
jgi:NAD(P)-dependent dehydrogenase (short-subunit alcohol dehydrogenase family)